MIFTKCYSQSSKRSAASKQTEPMERISWALTAGIGRTRESFIIYMEEERYKVQYLDFSWGNRRKIDRQEVEREREPLQWRVPDESDVQIVTPEACQKKKGKGKGVRIGGSTDKQQPSSCQKGENSVQEGPESIEVQQPETKLTSKSQVQQNGVNLPDTITPTENTDQPQQEQSHPQQEQCPLSPTEELKQLPSQITSQKQVFAFILNCKISLSRRNLQDYPAIDVLLVPFKTSSLEFYPGNSLKDTLVSERETLSKAEMFNGGIYVKNKLAVGNYKFVAFLKVKLEDFATNLACGLNLLLAKTKKDGHIIHSIVLFLEEGMNVAGALKGISKSKQLKQSNNIELCLSVRDEAAFKEQSRQFMALVSKHMASKGSE